jgi:integrase
MRKTLSDKGVAALKPRAQRYAVPDPELRGHWIRVTPTGAKSFVTVTRGPEGKQVWSTIGATDVMTITEARERAREILKRVRSGQPAIAPRGETFGAVTENWLKRHVEPSGLRSRDKIVGLLNRHVDADFRARELTGIRRTDIVALLDEVEDDHGARQAHNLLAIIRSIMNWQAARCDDFVPPLVRGMSRINAKARARDRILSDDELRAVWTAAEANGTYGALVRLLLLTGQRLDKVRSMRWADIGVDGTWKIRTAAREKSNAGELALPAMALDIIRAQPQLGDNPYVLAGRGNAHISAAGNVRTLFAAKLLNTPHWTLHDLRRTARSLMSRAGVRPDIGERTLGHAIGGVEAIYDRHHYANEKADALARLAALVQKIVAAASSHASDKAA